MLKLVALSYAAALSAADFNLNGKMYTSQAEFIASGRRCGTLDVPVAEKHKINAEIAAYRAAGRLSASTPRTVAVYWHTITGGQAAGLLLEYISVGWRL